MIAPMPPRDPDIAAAPNARRVIPALGLSWANVVNTRLMLQRQRSLSTPGTEGSTTDGIRRSIHVVLAAHLPNVSAGFVVEQGGVRGLAM